MKFKKIGIYVLVFMNLFFIFLQSTTAITKEEGVMEAFKNSKASIEGININAHVNMANVFTNSSEGKEICFKLGNALGLENMKIKDTSEKENIQLCLRGKKEGETICVIVQSIQEKEIRETNIVIDFVDDELVDISVVGKKLEGILQNYGKVKVTSCMTGSFEGKLNRVQKENVLEKLVKGLKIKEIEGFRDGKMVSIVGFSSKIKDYISYGGNKVNINIALRYNSYEGKTYLWIGTPLIAIGY